MTEETDCREYLREREKNKKFGDIMLKDTLIALLIAFVVTAIVCPFFIPILHRFKFGQMVRDDGPKEHLKRCYCSIFIYYILWYNRTFR